VNRFRALARARANDQLIASDLCARSQSVLEKRASLLDGDAAADMSATK